jgi:hypothetical protein
MLFREPVAVYCENHTEHTDTLCGQKTHFVPHRKHITSVAVYCENHTEHTNTHCGQNVKFLCVKAGGTYRDS